MAEPILGLSNFDRLVHEPSRLMILTALAACRSADFVYLRRLTGLSLGNLSQHLTKLEAARLITIEKTFYKKRPRTIAQLSDAGRQALDDYWRRLDEARKWAANPSTEEKLAPEDLDSGERRERLPLRAIRAGSSG